MQRILCLTGVLMMLLLFVPSAAAQQPARSYLLLGKADKLPNQLGPGRG